jgi:outer membrane protein OmpA-like peptidoglycan-associated protein
MPRHRHLLLLFGYLMAAPAGAEPVDVTDLGEPVERHVSGDQTFRQWVQDQALLDSERGDRLETRQVIGEQVETVKLKNVVPPIRFESGVARIPQNYVDKLAEVLESVRHRRNVRVHFVGHADSQPLSEALARVFENNSGLSRERAGEVAEYFKSAHLRDWRYADPERPASYPPVVCFDVRFDPTP